MSDRLFLGLDNSLGFLNLVLGTEDRLIEERHSQEERLSSEMLPVRVSRLLAGPRGRGRGPLCPRRDARPRFFHRRQGRSGFLQGPRRRSRHPSFRHPYPRRPRLTLRLHGRLLPLPAHRREKGRGVFCPLPGLERRSHPGRRNPRLETR